MSVVCHVSVCRYVVPVAGAAGPVEVSAVPAASVLAMMGAFDLIGTIGSGWLSDRYDNRKLLFWYYALRGLSLFWLPFSTFTLYGLSLFAMFYGLDWIATVPPTVRLTADAFGILPPIARLTPEQAMYHFLSGYTAKVAGTERGLGNEPQPEFSTCFGSPFLPLDPSVYGNMLRELIAGRSHELGLMVSRFEAGEPVDAMTVRADLRISALTLGRDRTRTLLSVGDARGAGEHLLLVPPSEAIQALFGLQHWEAQLVERNVQRVVGVGPSHARLLFRQAGHR